MATIKFTGTGTDLCVICGIKVYFGEDSNLINSRKEIYFKFTVLLSRYLNMECTKETLNYYNSNYCHFDNTSHKNSICCFTCHVKMQAFCDTSHKLECLQLELFRILESLSKLMEVTSSTIHNFQEELISKVQKKKQRHGPFVRLEKLSESQLQLLQKSLTFEIESASKLIKPEMQDDEDEECDLRLSDHDDGAYDDIDESTSQFELEQNFDISEEKAGTLNLEATVSDDPTNPIDMVDNYLVNMQIENSSPQKAVCVTSKRKAKTKRPRKCLICDKIFSSYSNQLRHIRSHIGEKVFHCQTCLKEFAQPQDCTRHKLTHHRSGRVTRKPKAKPKLPRQCLMCEKIFSTNWNLVRHISMHIGENVFHCRICLKEFAGPQDCSRHKKSHYRSGGVMCEICGKTVENIETHCMEAHKPVINVCDICGKTFNFPGILRRHMERIHGDGKPTKNFKCHYVPCKFAFYDIHHLEQHIRTHTKERPFQCDQCGSAFSQKGSLKRHMQCHSRIKKFSCEACGQSFLHRHNLKRHEKTHEKI